jgi:RNA polymerase sigma factor (TIGR02999 family)
MEAQHTITEELFALRSGDDAAAWNRLAPLVYGELRAIAHRQLYREADGHTLTTTALVHEAYLKLVDQRRAQWQDRSHFFAIAAHVMRRVLVDYARHHLTRQRTECDDEWAEVLGVELPFVAIADDAIAAADARAQTLVSIEDALTRLGTLDERLVRVVECRFFAGLTEEETAAAIGVTARTVRRDWIKAKAWLRSALEDSAT